MRREHRKYTPITCIIGTGTQYINTLYKFTDNANKHRILMSYRKTGTSSNNTAHIFGSAYNSSSQWFNAYTDANNSYSSQCYVGSTGIVVWVMDYTLALFNLDFTVQNNTSIYLINGVQSGLTSYTGNIVSGGDIFIFACSRVSPSGLSGAKARMKLYYFKIYESDILVRDFIPVLDYQKVPCLYDRVSQSFYYNAGTGTFGYEL